MYRHLFVCMYSVILSIYLELKLLSHMVILYLTFCRAAMLFAKQYHHFVPTINFWEGSRFSISSPALLLISSILIIAILVGIEIVVSQF